MGTSVKAEAENISMNIPGVLTRFWVHELEVSKALITEASIDDTRLSIHEVGMLVSSVLKDVLANIGEPRRLVSPKLYKASFQMANSTPQESGSSHPDREGTCWACFYSPWATQVSKQQQCRCSSTSEWQIKCLSRGTNRHLQKGRLCLLVGERQAGGPGNALDRLSQMQGNMVHNSPSANGHCSVS